jgi:NDP-sugar pyrophosphorylase family protein
MHAVVIAGGKGVRLRPFTTSLPKPLVPIGDELPIIEIVIRQLQACGFTDLTIAVGHLGHIIRAYVGEGRRWGINVTYADEDTPLGTAGPVVNLADELPEHFLVMNGDVLTDMDFGTFLKDHIDADADLTVAACRRLATTDFGVIEFDGDRMTGFLEKPTVEHHVSMGVYALARRTVQAYEKGRPLGFDELMLDLLARGARLRAYRYHGYWLDIGRPDDYEQANEDFPRLKRTLLADD